MRIFLLASMSWLATDRSPSICISLTLIQSDRPLQHVFVIRSMVSSSNFSVLGIFYSFINWNSTTDVSGEIFLISHPKALFGKIVVDIFSLSSQMETNALNRATKNGVVCLPYISRSGIDDAEKENAQKKSLKSSQYLKLPDLTQVFYCWHVEKTTVKTWHLWKDKKQVLPEYFMVEI